MAILGIETSCDDTAVAIIQDGTILSDYVYTQVVHKRWGGVVPELASRDHAKKIYPTVKEAIETANIDLSELEGIAVTAGPGLAGSVIVGLTFAKSLAYMLNIPLIGINHTEGHIFGALLDRYPPSPFIAMIVSGGHTHMYLSRIPGVYELLGKTRDDAAGEAFDKIAKFLGYSYPGGPHIQKLAETGDHRKIKFPIGMKIQGNLEFSFSGLKTAVMRKAKEVLNTNSDITENDIAASLQENIAETLIYKLKQAINHTKVRRVVISGGVVANSRFRERLDQLSQSDIEIILPQRKYCTDNGVMIAFAGAFRLKNDFKSSFSLTAQPNMPLEKIPFAI